jgi:3-deoxy-D-manno-octulosonate 8-phosphate phosphatase (KDO 8-P phosphatase)
MQLSDDVRARAARVRLLCLDVDGVLTDGSLHYGSSGEALKRYHVRDGMGVRMLLHHGFGVAVISARASELVKVRMADLKIPHWCVGRDDKNKALDELLSTVGLTADEVAYLGDDILDLPVMRRVGLSVAVRDAHPCLWPAAHLRTEALGGNGAVREVADVLLEAHHGLAAAYEMFLSTGLGHAALEKA